MKDKLPKRGVKDTHNYPKHKKHNRPPVCKDHANIDYFTFGTKKNRCVIVL